MADHETEVERRIAADLRHEAAALTRLADRIDPPAPTARLIPSYQLLSEEKAEELAAAQVTEIVTVPLSQGAVMVTKERDRQIREEGHVDDKHHAAAELAWAAACYVTRAADIVIPQDHPGVPTMWPWSDKEWKPKPDRVRNLVIAAALIVAEIDRTLEEPQ